MIATATSIQDIKKVPFYAQFTDEQIRAQLTKNIASLEQMRGRAIKSGKKVGGFTVVELEASIQNYKNILAA